MGKNKDVEAADILADALEAELRRRIDLHVQPVHDDVHRCARPTVARIAGGADRTIARDHRDALRRASTKKYHFHRAN